MDSVLIVDDEELVRQMLVRVLRPGPYVVYEAAGADAALDMLSSQRMAVMLCDRRMPGRDGDWLITQVRERFPALAVVLMTADDAVPPRVSLQPGVVGYVVKPFTPDTIRDAVRDATVWHHAAARRNP